jgi:hypothetical protein
VGSVKQDVISRQAKAIWLPSFLSRRTADTLHHVPSRWSRRRPAARDELKSTTCLTCPSQPDFGWVYLDAVHYIVEGNRSPGAYLLPERQIFFQDESISAVLSFSSSPTLYLKGVSVAHVRREEYERVEECGLTNDECNEARETSNDMSGRRSRETSKSLV